MQKFADYRIILNYQDIYFVIHEQLSAQGFIGLLNIGIGSGIVSSRNRLFFYNFSI